MADCRAVSSTQRLSCRAAAEHPHIVGKHVQCMQPTTCSPLIRTSRFFELQVVCYLQGRCRTCVLYTKYVLVRLAESGSIPCPHLLATGRSPVRKIYLLNILRIVRQISANSFSVGYQDPAVHFSKRFVQAALISVSSVCFKVDGQSPVTYGR